MSEGQRQRYGAEKKKTATKKELFFRMELRKQKKKKATQGAGRTRVKAEAVLYAKCVATKHNQCKHVNGRKYSVSE